jgi:ATP-dependent RNA helicase SUPV3L1/SUV3
VRVDILERLADLIRPALAWRADSKGPKPPGAVNGFAFTVSTGMTSLAGCSGPAFGSVLRSLGYRMEKRAKPVETLSPIPALDALQSSPATVAAAVAEADAPLISMVEIEPPAASSEQPNAEITATLDASPNEDSEVSPSANVVVEVPEAPALAASEQVLMPEALPQEMPQVPGTARSGAKDSIDFMEVWRPGRRDENKSSQRASRRHRSHASRARTATAHASSTTQASAAAEQVEQPASPGPSPAPPRSDQSSSGPSGRRRHGREKEADERLGPDRRERRRNDMASVGRAGRSQALERADRSDRPGRPARVDRPDRDPVLRAKYIKANTHAGAAREPDPDSPFAKLAKLKEQLETNAKEPR